MTLPKLSDFKVSGKKVLLRLDLDVGNDYTRVEDASETLKFLVENRAKIIIIGHRGRPEGKIVGELSLAPLADVIRKIVGKKINFVYDIVGVEAQNEVGKLGEGEIMMLENLRFDSREEKNDEGFAKALASLGEFYVNEAFADSHREHASIVALPLQFKFKSKNSVAAGFRFIKEVENLRRVLENPKRPVVIIISGVKEDKVEMAKALAEKFDTVLVGGKLPLLMQNSQAEPDPALQEKIKIANLIADTQDITINSVNLFKQEITKAGTIVLAGVLGVYEDEGHRQGTKEIFEAVAASSAFKVAGGGDTEAAISLLGLTEKFDWISVGGGAMLEFLVNRTLPGIEALKL